MPSRRPVKPSPSVVVAFALTRAGSMFRISAIRARIAEQVRSSWVQAGLDGARMPVALQQYIHVTDSAAEALEAKALQSPFIQTPPMRRLDAKACVVYALD